MSLSRRGAAALRREECGFTLIELLIATSLGLVVIGAALTMFLGAIHSQPRDTSKVAAMQEARTTVDRITRELRQGLEVVSSPAPTTSRLEIVTYVKAVTCGGAAASTSIPCRVIYVCSGTTCTRTVAQPSGSAPGPAVRIATGLVSPNVFSYSPSVVDPSYVGVSFVFSNSSGRPFTLGDGVTLRNPSEAS
jgi:prepilin-type N-terminal cleavage/methylation domain-containing protein